jgi:hypothetical protein
MLVLRVSLAVAQKVLTVERETKGGGLKSTGTYMQIKDQSSNLEALEVQLEEEDDDKRNSLVLRIGCTGFTQESVIQVDVRRST